MKRFISIRNVVRLLCALTLAVLLISPKTAHAGSATINQGETKPYTASSNGETITVNLSNAYTSVQLQGKPMWISCKKDGTKFTLTVDKNTTGDARKSDVVFRDGSKLWTLRVTQNPVVVYVSFNVNGGSGSIGSKTYTVSKTYGSLPAGPTPPKGHSFDGWYTAKSGGSKITTSSTVSASYTTLYAHYSAKKYTVTFNSNGGSSCSSQKVTYNTAYGSLPTPSRSGYKFLGWYTSSSGGTKITSSSTHTSASDITLYAHWEASPVTVVVAFNNNGGYGNVPSQTYYVGQKYGSLPAGSTPPSGGYKFEGWYTAKTGGSKITTDTVVSASYTTLYAHYKAKDLTVSFDSCNGSAVSSTRTVVFDGTYGSLPTTERKGYTFLGWFTAKTGGSEVTPTTKVTTTVDHTLYAHWRANTYKVTFTTDGGSAVSAITVTFGGTYGTLPTSKKDGYTLLGWFTAKTGGTKITPQTVVTTAADHTLYAQWKGDPLTVKFDNNGGYGDVPSKTYIVGDPYGSLPAGSTAPNGGYKFGGWYTAKVGGVRIYKDTIVSYSYKTLYAHYIARTFTVTFDNNNGSDPTTKKVTYDSAYNTLPQPTREGYAFRGWYTGLNGGTRVNAQSIVTTAADHTLYAHWEVRRFRVTFDSNNGSDIASKVVTYDSPYGKLEMPIREGYTFKGWYTKLDGGTRVTASTIVKTATDHTLYAHWKANIYEVTFDSKGGGSFSPIKVTYDSKYGSLPTPKKDHYTFQGWFTSSGLQVLPSTIVKTAGDHKLIAHWRKIEAVITFDVNGGNGANSERVIKVDSKLGILVAPKRTNYTFVGWYTAKNGGEQVYSITRIQNTQDRTYYAHWVRNTDFVITDLVNLDGVKKDGYKKGWMAHFVSCHPSLSSDEQKKGFTEFVIDFYTDRKTTGTYWALCQCRMDTSDLTNRGYRVYSDSAVLYAGLQFTVEGPKVDLALWRTAYEAKYSNYNVIDAATKTVYPGDDMGTFDNEGCGKNYLKKFTWNPNTWYRMYLRCFEGDNGNTFVELQIQEVGTSSWTKVVVIDTNLKNSFFTGGMTQFMENYTDRYCNQIRTFAFRNIWVKPRGGSWKFIDSVSLQDSGFEKKKGLIGFGRNNTTVYGITCGYGAKDTAAFADVSLKCNNLQSTISRPITPYSN